MAYSSIYLGLLPFLNVSLWFATWILALWGMPTAISWGLSTGPEPPPQLPS